LVRLCHTESQNDNTVVQTHFDLYWVSDILTVALFFYLSGTVFTARKLESEKKNAVKKFATVFAKRVAQSARPSSCQTCECTADNNGMSYMECFPCEYPSPVMIDYVSLSNM
jgi:hypothetical protein